MELEYDNDYYNLDDNDLVSCDVIDDDLDMCDIYYCSDSYTLLKNETMKQLNNNDNSLNKNKDIY